MVINNSRGAMPMYLQIKEDIKQKITSEEFKQGELIPTEIVYQDIYDVSRTTVRQAINELQMEGYVKRYRGKGTVVVWVDKIEEKMSKIKSFTDEIIDRGGVPSTSLVNASVAPSTPEQSIFFNILPKTMLLKIERVRSADDIPIVLFETYLELNPSLPLNVESYYGSLYELLSTTINRTVARIEEKFEAVLADEYIANMLDIKKNDALFLRTRYSYDQNNKPLEFTKSYYVGDKYSYSLELTSG